MVANGGRRVDSQVAGWHLDAGVEQGIDIGDRDAHFLVQQAARQQV